jgi:hypothetical protein
MYLQESNEPLRAGWIPSIKYICTVGFRAHENRIEKNQIKEDEEQGIPSSTAREDLESISTIGTLPCHFYLRYRREYELDTESQYLLVDYNISHTHPLSAMYFTNLLKDQAH